MFALSLKTKIMTKEQFIEAANLALVSLGVFVAFKYQTPITIAVGALAFFLGVVDSGITNSKNN
jgi:hypothetical protein